MNRVHFFAWGEIIFVVTGGDYVQYPPTAMFV